MKRHVLYALASGLALGLGAASVHAYHCPLLVKECRAVAGKVEKRAGSDMSKVARAKEGCEEALRLHEQGDHKAAVIKAGEAISLAGEAAK